MAENTTSQRFDYMAEARLTCSPVFHGGKVPKLLFREALNDAIKALSKLDRIKKSLFYGRELPASDVQEFASVAANDCMDVPAALAGRNRDVNDCVNILHGIIGKATESSELLEAFYNCVFNGSPFDATNACEEVGDGFWYDALILGAIGQTFDSAQRANIAKLRARFPQRFTEYDANNRNVTAERQVLDNYGMGNNHTYKIEWKQGESNAHFRILGPDGAASAWAAYTGVACLEGVAAVSDYYTGSGDKIGPIADIVRKYIASRSEGDAP